MRPPTCSRRSSSLRRTRKPTLPCPRSTADQKKTEEAWGIHSQAAELVAAMPESVQRAQMEALSLHVGTYIKLAEGKDAEAIEMAQQVIAYEDVSPYAATLALSNLGIMNARARRYDEAIEYLEHAFQMNPYFYRAGGALGRILIVRGKHARAAEVLGKLVEMNPETEGGTHYAYGMALARTQRREEALQQYQLGPGSGVAQPGCPTGALADHLAQHHGALRGHRPDLGGCTAVGRSWSSPRRRSSPSWVCSRLS